MGKKFVLLVLFLFFVSGAYAGIYIYEPQDKLVTFKNLLMLTGTGRELEILKINGQRIKFDADGKFSCGLVLRKGKNLVEVRALDEGKKHFVKKIRILRLETFPDIEALYEGKKHWARNQIIYLSSLGFIEGHPDNNFYPGHPITRGELATWIARVKKLKVEALTEDVFFDVPKEHWRAPYVKAVVAAGYMGGYDTQTFGLEEPISRREAAEIVVRTEGFGVVEKVKPLFIDVPKAERGAFPIFIAKEKGLVKGVSKGIPVYEPDRALTRAEAALLLSRFARAQNAVQYLFNFAKGFSSYVFCRLNVSPQIVSFTVEPGNIRLSQKSILQIRAAIAAREEFSPISKVKVDLSEIGGAPDVRLFDDGTHGDEERDDLVYSLNISLEPIVRGSKTLTVTAVDRLGWENKKQAPLLIVE